MFRYKTILLGGILFVLVACGQSVSSVSPTSISTASPLVEPTATPTQAVLPSVEPTAALRDTLVIDGSSTVFPITEAVVQAFQPVAPQVQVQLGVSGTGGGFKKFCSGSSDISAASRPISQSEMAKCEEAGISFIELPIAFDGISVMTNLHNTWATCITVDELKRLWEPAAEGTILHWNQVRADWPDQPVTLYGAGGDSGTYDYFTSAIVGEEGVSRKDYTGSEDDYLLGQDLATDTQGLGFFGYSYYVEFQHVLNLVAIDSGQGCIIPSAASISDGSYAPLSRPLFIYVRVDALERPAVDAFVSFYLQHAPQLVEEVRGIPLTTRLYELSSKRFARRTLGSVFNGGLQVGLSLETLLTLEEK